VLGLLGDQAYMARALLDAHEVSGDSAYLDRALELARFLLDRFQDANAGGQTPGRPAGFFDTWDETDALGRLAERQKSVQDNAVCAEVFLRLYHLTREDGYREVARTTLEAFVAAYPHLGHFAAGYARQVDTLLNPPAEVNIVGDPAQEPARSLQRAALALDLPARVVQVLHPAREATRLEALFLPQEPVAAYVCLGTMCSAPVQDPEALAQTVAEMKSMATQPPAIQSS